jgi:peptide chain release factor
MQKFVQITSGRGPAECTRVVARVIQILTDEAGSKGCQASVIQKISGPENGSVESALLMIEGEDVTCFVNSWLGTVQWTGESEIRKDHKRKNWFIGIFEVFPSLYEEMEEKDIVYQAMRSSGAGGQHVNKVSSAIRVTHIPSGIQVVVMDSRSQHQNKKLAYQRLTEKFRQVSLGEIKKIELSQWKNQMSIERGNPIRVFKGSDFKKRKSEKGYKSQRLKLKLQIKNEDNR